MALISKGKVVADAWHHAGAEGPLADHAIVPLERISEATGKFGVLLPNNAELDTIKPYLEKLALIAINFPAFTDGRGFSLARLIRRAGFGGELRAFGNILPDQYTSALACGFDTIEISPERALRQPEANWAAAFAARDLAYQRGYDNTGSILDRRRAAK